MPNVRLRVAYDGTNYGGFQMQKNAVTVQEKLEKALYRLYGTQVKVVSAGRTDSGVHARGQAVSFHVSSLIPVDRIPWALNTCLPDDIVVWEATEVPAGFHAARDALSKLYIYTLDNATFRQVLRRRYTWHCPENLNLELMQEGGRAMEGSHDFCSFKGTGSEVKNTVRNIFRVEVTRDETEQLIFIKITGEGFMYKMVRFMAGALVELGRQSLELDALKKALAGASSRVGPALPAKGLCLEEVHYE